MKLSFLSSPKFDNLAQFVSTLDGFTNLQFLLTKQKGANKMALEYAKTRPDIEVILYKSFRDAIGESYVCYSFYTDETIGLIIQSRNNRSTK